MRAEGRRFIAWVLVVFLMLALTAYTQAPVQAASAKEGVINADGVNLRSKPSLEADILTKIKSEEKVTVLSDADGWYRIKYGKLSGYVKEQFVTVHVTDLQIKATLVKDKVNMRKGPGTDADLVQQLACYTEVTIIGTFGDWDQIKVGSKRATSAVTCSKRWRSSPSAPRVSLPRRM